MSAAPQAAEDAPSDEEKALDYLATMFDAYENGPDCYEDPEDCSGHLGKAIRVDNDDFHAIADLLNRRRPVAAMQPQPTAPAEGGGK
jgi:hypothetical protein